jgi:hypothetical protein
VQRTEESNGAPSLRLRERRFEQPAEPPSGDFITRNSGNAEFVEVGYHTDQFKGVT